MPSETRRCVGMAPSTAPSNCIAPSRCASRPMMVRISVVLPAPLRPMRPANSPAPTSMLTLRRMAIGPMDTETRSSRSMCLLANHVTAHLLRRQDLGGGTVGDHPALVERDHAVGIARHDVHVVLDEQHRDALPAYRAHDEIHDLELLVRGDAARRLVEQQQL